MKNFAVAVDGPAGSGKSTVAKIIAQKLDIIYVDTGAMYRSIAYFSIDKNIDINDELAVANLLNDIDLKIIPNKDGQKIELDGFDITDLIRTQEIGQGASIVAQYERVRTILGNMQKQMAVDYSVIMDGRDIGTNILPNAEVKIYLDAGVKQRALRRGEELKAKGLTVDFGAIEEEIRLRDKADIERELNPLRQAEDAVYIDTTDFTIDEVVDKIVNIVHERA